MLDLTVIVCTRNRAKSLAKFLDSATALHTPEGLNWEFIIVDNGSSDNTMEVVASFADRLPIRCVREETPGLSNARNCGVREAQGAYICWTDDDVILDTEWLVSYAESFRKHPEAVIFGGRVIPVLEAPTPTWFKNAMAVWPLNSITATRDFGDEEIPLDFKKGLNPWGANFAVRTAEQKQHLYNPQLGVAPTHKRTGEEVDVMYKMVQKGASGWWVPGSKVLHQIPLKRQSLAYIYEYCYQAGETFAFIRAHYPSDNHYFINGTPPDYSLSRFRFYRRALMKGFCYILATLIRTNQRFYYLGKFAYYWGAASYKNMK
ncbi:glycosyltransferase family 2 protein [Methylovorus menthalis]|uniref:glycosyltransferase n=1 Tax=Methylovorus menthalis TaxID=1002227 RepID=UPI001E59A467|nr:glycosyltransferase [Methylovorus menthalis]MCB4811369.1 glycosyltransferase family 2 protein [Methylovorus menthalis]